MLRAPLLLFLCVLLLSLGGSAVSLADGAFDSRPFCGFESGCEAVTSTIYGRPLGVPLATIGLVGFGVLFALALFPTARSFALVGPLAVLAGAAGVILVGIQAVVLGRFCPLCLFVDATAIAAAAVAVRGKLWRAAGSEMSWLVRSGWLAAAGVAAVGPVLLGWAIEEPEPPVPEQVKAYWVDGALTMVEVTDFDCPHCRRAEPLIGAFRREHPELRFVRLAAPMPAHAHARPAARAFLAAQAQGAGEDMAALLLTAENRDAAHCREYAARLRMDLDKFDRVVGAPATDAELDATVEWARAAGTGLPMVWIQGKRIQGVPTYDALTFALERARKE